MTTRNQEHFRYVHEHMKQEYFTQLTIRNMSGMFMNTWSRSTSHNSQSGTRQVCSWTHEAGVLHTTHNQEHVRYVHEHMKQEYFTQLTIRHTSGMFMNTWSRSTSHNSQSGTCRVCSWTHEAGVLHTTHNQEHVRYVHEHMKQEYFTQLTIRNTSGMFMNTWSRSTSHNSQSGTRQVCSWTHEAGVLHTTHNQEHVGYVHEHMKQEYFTQLTIRNMSGMFMNTWSRSTTDNSQSGTRQVCSWTHEAGVLHTTHNQEHVGYRVCSWTHEAGVLHTTHNQEHVRYVHEHMKQEYFTQLTIRNISGMFMNTWSRSTSHNSQSGTRQVCSWTHEAGVLHTTHNQEHVRYVHEHMKQEYFTQLTIRNTSGMFMHTWSRSISHNSQDFRNTSGMFMNTWSRSTSHNSQSGTRQVCSWTHEAGILHTTHNQEHVRYVHEHMKQEYYTQLTIRNTSGMFMNTWNRSTSHNSQDFRNTSGMFMNTWSRSTSHNSQSGTHQVCSWTHEAGILHTTHSQEHVRYVYEHMKQDYFTQLPIRNTSGMFMNTWSRSTSHNSQSGTHQVCSWTHEAGILHTTHSQEHVRYVYEHMKQDYFTQLTIRNTSGMFMNTWSRSISHNSQDFRNTSDMFMNTWNRSTSHNSQSGTHQVCSWTHEAGVLHTTHNQEHVRYVHEHMKQEYFTQLTIRNT